MRFVEFVKKYSTEKKCIELFRTLKETKGITCPKCGSESHYWNTAVKSHDCKTCKHRTTLRSGTVMESSKLPYQYWLYAIYLMTMTKKSISALEMQRQLGHKRYEPIWYMMHKIRSAMGIRDESYNFEGVIELDDAFFKTHSKEKEENEKKKRGRGSQNQSKVLVMAKVDPKKGRPKKYKKSSAFRYVKMIVIPDSSWVIMNEEVALNTTGTTKIKSDGWRGFSRIKEVSTKHIKQVVPPQESSKILPWVHTMISNAKRNLLGTNHNVSDQYLQNYLNEFCYKTNRRYFGINLFERLMNTAISDTWYGKFSYQIG